jgi:hypothetical protein
MTQANFHRVVFSQGDALVTVKRVGQFREVTASRGQRHIGTWMALTSERRAQCIGWAVDSLGDAAQSSGPGQCSDLSEAERISTNVPIAKA